MLAILGRPPIVETDGLTIVLDVAAEVVAAATGGGGAVVATAGVVLVVNEGGGGGDPGENSTHSRHLSEPL